MNLIHRFIVSNPSLFSIHRLPSLFRKLLPSIFIRIHISALRKVNLLTPGELQEFQLQRLRALIRHAYKDVPFWRKYISASSLKTPENLLSLEDLAKIPVTSKRLLRPLSLTERLAKGIPQARALLDGTSGTTGEPFGFYLDLWSADRKTSLYFRGFEWKKAFPSLSIIRARHRDLSLITVGEHIPFDDYSKVDEVLRVIEKKCAGKVLHSHASQLELLGKRAKELDLSIRPAVIFTTSEYCAPETKKMLREVFQCPVSDSYGSREVDNIGQECDLGSMHINSDQCIVEIVNSKGERVPIGDLGDIALTFFNNTLMPFIRYVNGDRGRLLASLCACGLPYPVLVFEGRNVEFIKLAPGKILRLLQLMRPLQNRGSHMLQFQIRRIGYVEFEVLYVPAPGADPLPSQEITQEMRAMIGTKSLIKIRQVSSLFKAGQKSVPYLDLWTSTIQKE